MSWRSILLTTAVLLAIAGLGWRIVSAGATTPRDHEEHERVAGQVRSLLSERRFDEAEDLARQAGIDAERTFGAESEQAADALDLLVEALYRRGEYRSPETTTLAERAVRLRERLHGPDHPAVARSLHRLSLIAYFDVRQQESLALAERALEVRERALGPDHPEVAESLRFVGTLYDELGQSDRGRELLERSLRIRDESLGPDHPDVADSLNYLANCLSRSGHFEEALAHYRRSEAIYARAHGDRHPGVAKSRYNQAMIHETLGDYVRARQLIERSVRLYEELLGADHPTVFIVRSGLASLLRKTGEYASARAQYEVVLEGLARTYGADQPYYAGALSKLADLMGASGDLDQALALYERALEIYREAVGPSTPDAANGMVDIASVLVRKDDHAGARRLYAGALTIQQATLGPADPELARTLSGMARASRLAGDTSEARRLAARGLAVYEQAFGPDHPSVVEPLLFLGDLLASAGELEEARSSLRRALETVERAMGPGYPKTAEILHADARALVLMSRPGEALDTALRGAAVERSHVLEAVRAFPESEALTYAGHMRANVDLALSLMAANGTGRTYAAARAWDAVIRSRALVLDEMAARQRAVVGSPDPEIPRLAEELRSARQRLANLLVRGPEDLPAAHYREIVDAARGDRERAELFLADRSREYRSQLERKRLGLDDVRRRLPAGSGLLAYVMFEPLTADGSSGAPAYLAFVLGPDHAEPRVLSLGPAATVDDAVRAWRTRAAEGALGNRAAAALTAYRAAGRTLRRLIWDPVATDVEGLDPLFVVPDGSLNLVNLGALPVGKDRYLVETGPTLHLLSTERDVAESNEPDERGRGLLAVGAPAFEATSLFAALAAPEGIPAENASAGALLATAFRGSTSSCGDFQAMRFEALPATLGEIDEVSAVWAGGEGEDDPTRGLVRLTGDQAGEARFKRLAPGRRILHLATHGFFLQGRCPSGGSGRRGVGGLVSPPPVEQESPLLLSGLALAGANHRGVAGGDEDDGILTAEEIAALDLSGVEWAVLSACDTGLGEVRSGEGVFGLRRAFRVAGAGTVIMSLWSVDDESARRWMRGLYRARFMERLDTAGAVRRATLDALTERRERDLSTHPFFWAGFVASGDWR